MERLTYVAENGEVLFHPADLPDDEGITITQLAKDGRYKALEEIAERLANREQAEEQGLLLRLPCGIGSDVYIIPSKINCGLNILSLHPENNKVYHQKVALITFTEKGWYMECDKDREYATDRILSEKMYKETWFLSQEEAEAKLKEMEKKDV